MVFSAGASLGSPAPAVSAPSAVVLAHSSTAPSAPVPSPGSLLSAPSKIAASPSLPATNVNGTFYQNYTVPSVTGAKLSCPSSPYSYIFLYCFPDDQDPTTLLLGNGNIGLSFSRVVNHTANTCTNATNNTVIRVAFSISTNNGSSFGTPTMLGNDTCPYIQALEPSFGVSSTGAVYGAFVEANASISTLYPTYYQGPVVSYTARSSDALGFVSSLDNGTTFSTVSTISIAGNANIARPALATFGQTIYIVYENISNGTTYVNATSSNPISVEMVYSSNGGASWNGPYALPGLNSYESYTAMSPSIAVNKTGKVAVAYATDRHCIGYCNWGTYAQEYGDSIVVATSTTNGTTWSGPNYVSKDVGVGESAQYYGSYSLYKGGASLYEWTPETSIAFSPSGTSLFVAWSGAINRSTGYYYYDWESTQVFSGVSTDGGVTWANSTVGPTPLFSWPPYIQSAYNPAIGVSPTGEVYYTYTYYNDSAYGSGSCGGSVNPLAVGYWQSILSSSDGLHWSSPAITNIGINTYGGYQYIGHLASIAFNRSGDPVVGYTVLEPFQFVYTGVLPFIYEYPSVVQVATSWSRATVPVTFQEQNLPAGTPWGVEVDGEVYSTTSSNLTILNTPKNAPVLIVLTLSNFTVGYRTEVIGTLSTSDEPIFTGATTVWLNYTTFYGVTFQPDPKAAYVIEFEYYNATAIPFVDMYYEWYDYGGFYQEFYNCPFPWYFAAGTKIHASETFTYPSTFYIYAPFPIGYWNGTGNGSYTGPGSNSGATIDVSGPINETFWAQGGSTYNVSVLASGLPSTSVYHFQWDGTSYSGSASSPALVHNVSTGAYQITNAWANSSQSGWEYFGVVPDNGSVAVPEEPVVNLSFAFVDLSASVGTVSFHANGLTNGTVWHFAFNGTEYSSSTPWINVTTRSGSFPEAGFPVVSANGSATYAPVTLAPMVNVTTGSTYPVDFTSAFQLTMGTSVGGRISPGTGAYWEATGASRSISATANPGFTFVGWSGTGAGAYTGLNPNATLTMNGPVVETANFAPLAANRFYLNFSDGNSLPNGTWWTVYVDGVGYSSDTSSISVPHVYSCLVSGSLGRYTIVVPYAYVNSSQLTRYVPASYASTVCGGGATVTFTFGVQYFLTLEATAGGTAQAVDSVQSSSSGMWVGPSDLVTLTATAFNGYTFLGWNGTGAGNYTGTVNPESVSLSGPVTELASFAPVYIPPPQRYNVDFHLAVAFTDGTIWTVMVNGTTYASSGTDLTVSGLLATSPGHPYAASVPVAKSPDGLTLYTPAGAPTSLSVSGNATVTLTYRTSYWVSVDAIGGGAASIQVGNSNATSGWYASGTTITLNASATSPWLFNGWSGGAYSGTQSSYSLQVTGPIHEVATFVPPAPAAKVITSMWASPVIWAGLAVAGVIVGLVVGIMVSRMRRGGRA